MSFHRYSYRHLPGNQALAKYFQFGARTTGEVAGTSSGPARTAEKWLAPALGTSSGPARTARARGGWHRPRLAPRQWHQSEGALARTASR